MVSKRTDPVERIIQEVLEVKNVRYTGERSKLNKNLDFYLPAYQVHIECKAFYTDRTSKQMERVDNCIVIQGMKAAVAFKELLNGK